MGISTPGQAIPSRPAAVSATSVVYFEDFLYNATSPLPVDFSGLINMSQLSVDANHPGVWSSDLSVQPPVLNWLPASPGVNFFTLQEYETLDLEWMFMLTGNPGGTRFQQAMGWSAGACVLDVNTAAVLWSTAACVNTPGAKYYLATDNGGSGQYIDTGVTIASLFNAFHKFNLQWNKAAGRISLLIDGVQKATTITNIPDGSVRLPFFTVNGFAIGPNTNFWRIDYVKFSGTLNR